MQVDVLIIGAGAAGLMCAIEAGKRGRKVAVLEHADRVGKKILISGGGRCNFTNLRVEAGNFLSANPHFCKSALARYTPAHFLELVEKHRIEYYEKKLGQLFCKHSAKDIVAMLLEECRQSKVKIYLRNRIISVDKKAHFEVQSSEGIFSAESLVVATGGLSFASLGASPFGYDLARQFGHPIQDCQPALVPLTFPSEELRHWQDLSGVSAEVRVSCGGADFRENLLFTHRGLSGPAILQISSYWRPETPLRIDLFPEFDLASLLLEGKKADEKAELKNYLAAHLPKRLLERWCQRYVPSRPLHRYQDGELAEAVQRLHQWELPMAGTEGYPKAEVTRGGVATDALSSKNMESRLMPGLYFIGEVVDVTGHLGGYNFQWAWASGYAAGQTA